MPRRLLSALAAGYVSTLAACESFSSASSPDDAGANGDASASVDGHSDADANVTDALAFDGGPRQCSGTERVFDPFDDRPNIQGDWHSFVGEGSGSQVVGNGVLLITANAVADTARPRRALVIEWPNVSRVCVSFTMTIVEPSPQTSYPTTNSETLAMYLAANWGTRQTYAGLALRAEGPRTYAEHTNGKYEFRPSIAMRRPAGVPVMLVADFIADRVDIWVAETHERYDAIRGAAVGNPTIDVVLGVAQHGPAPQATIKYDDAQVTVD